MIDNPPISHQMEKVSKNQAKDEKENDSSGQAEKGKKDDLGKSTRNFLVVIVILALIGIVFYMVGTVFSPYKTTEDPDTITYNNFEFVKEDGFWKTAWQNEGEIYIIPLRYNPAEVEEIPLRGTLSSEFNESNIYVTFDPEVAPLNYTALAAAELTINLAQVQGLGLTPACTKNRTAACVGRPIIDCSESATTNESVIFIDVSNRTEVVMSNTCIRISGSGWDLLRSTDRLLYDLYNIIQ